MIMSSCLNYNKDSKTFTSEISTVEFNQGGKLGRMIFLYSEKSGKTAKFYHERNLCFQGEIAKVVYLPTFDAIKANPGLDGVKIELFNT